MIIASATYLQGTTDLITHTVCVGEIANAHTLHDPLLYDNDLKSQTHYFANSQSDAR